MCQGKFHIALVPVPHPRARHSIGACAAPSANPGVVHASHHLSFPEVPLPSRRILDVVGEALLRKLVRHHHDLLRASEIGHLLPAEDEKYAAAVDKIADFVVESCGGDEGYSRKQGRACMRSRHIPFSIDEKGRHIWLGCLWQALEQSEFPPLVRKEYWDWMEPFSIRMIGRPAEGKQPRRYPYEAVQLSMQRRIFAVCPR